MFRVKPFFSSSCAGAVLDGGDVGVDDVDVSISRVSVLFAVGGGGVSGVGVDVGGGGFVPFMSLICLIGDA